MSKKSTKGTWGGIELSNIYTYKELKAIKESFERVEKPATKCYWVGADECGIMVVTLDVHAIKGLDNLQTVEAANSNQARILYASTL